MKISNSEVEDMENFGDTFLGVVDSLRGTAHWRGEHEALVCGDARLTYAGLDERLNRVANGLRELGVKPGDRVATLMGNSIEALQTAFGILKAGCVAVPLSTMVPADVLARLLDDSEARAVLVEEPHRAKASTIRDGLGHVVDGGWIGSGFSDPGWTGYDDWMAASDPSDPGVVIGPDDVFTITYTSGTTGVPKGIVHTHRGRHNWATCLALTLRKNAFSRSLLTTPSYTGGSWTVFLPTLVAGGTVVIMPSFAPLSFLETVERERITHTLMVPTQFIMVMAEPGFESYDLSSLEIMASGAAPLRAKTKTEIIEKLSPNLIEIYGLTEGPGTVLYPEEMEGRIGSVGRPPLGMDIKITDDDGNELPRGEIGEITGRASGLLREYYKRPDLTEECIWRDELGRRYMKTGDVGRLDEDGYLYVLDRKKDMIVSGGVNIFASDIEEVIGKHEAVLDVTVIGVPHEKWGETPLALVIRADGAEATGDEIMEWSNERLGKYQRVSAVEFRDEFPRNALGKVLKRHLREEYSGSSQF
jgi:acyl-CoA synthetase (AMP-forming)/AMP-acid ligase II